MISKSRQHLHEQLKISPGSHVHACRSSIKRKQMHALNHDNNNTAAVIDQALCNCCMFCKAASIDIKERDMRSLTYKKGVVQFSNDALALHRKLHKWPRRLAACIVKAVPNVKTSMLSSTFTAATHFSGLATVEQGLKIIRKRSHKYGLQCRPVLVSATDRSKTSQKVLLGVCPKTACIHSDVCGFVKVSRKKFERARTFRRKVRLMLKSKLRRRMWCLQHMKDDRC